MPEPKITKDDILIFFKITVVINKGNFVFLDIIFFGSNRLTPAATSPSSSTASAAAAASTSGAIFFFFFSGIVFII